MDPLIHGLWTFLIFYRVKKCDIRKAIVFGIIPDIPVVLGELYLLTTSYQLTSHMVEHRFFYSLYSYTHSLIIFLPVLCIVWIIIRRFPTELLAWGFHILIDIAGHTKNAVPFLFPVLPYRFHSFFSWENPTIIVVNYLIVSFSLYLFYFLKRFKTKPSGV